MSFINLNLGYWYLCDRTLQEIPKLEHKFSKFNHVKKFICMFGSTYMYEQLFSKMKYIKVKFD